MNKQLKLRDGVEIYCEFSSVDKSTWIVHTHGVGEYAGRHNWLVEEFGVHYNVLRYDLRGHGRSGGKRAWVSNFFDYIRDLDEVISHLASEFQMKDYVMMGHSMGAEITCGWVQNFAKDNIYPSKIVVTSPPVNVGGPLEKLAEKVPYRVVKFLADINLSLPLKGLVDLNGLSHDPQVAIDYRNNENNCTKLHTKLAFNILKGVRDIFSRPINPNCPAFITIGTKDKVVSYKTNTTYFKDIERDFIYKEFEGAMHELHNELPPYRDAFIKYLREVVFN
jgi:acylglycerol lipase